MILSSFPRRIGFGLWVLLTICLIIWLAIPASVGSASRKGDVQPPMLHRVEPRANAPLDLRTPRLALARKVLLRQFYARVALSRQKYARAILSRQHSALQAWMALHRDMALHASGAQLYTAWGTPFTIRAINWYGFEYAPYVPGGLDELPLDTLLKRLHELGFNALRMQYADATVVWNPVVRSGLRANPKLQGLHALDILQRIVERAGHFGLRVILCNSRSEPGMGPENSTGLWYTKQFPESVWQHDWIELATRLKHDSAFVGADLRNEPHITGKTMDLEKPGGAAFDQQVYFKNGPLWGAYQGTYYHDRDWHYAAQTMGNQLLAINPHLLIIVEGVQLYLDPERNRMLGGLWGSNLVGVQYDPIVLSRPGQLVYSAHEYGPQMFWARWFNKGTTYQSLARRWTSHWGYLLKAPLSMRAPIFIGEVGTCNNYYACIASPRPWRQGFWWQSFVRYLRSNPQVGWAYWSLNPDGPFYPGQDNFYSLVTRDWKYVHPMLLYGLKPLLHERNLTGKGLP